MKSSSAGFNILLKRKESEGLGTVITLACARRPEKLKGLTEEKENRTVIAEDLSLEHDNGKHELNLDNSGLRHINKVSSKNVRASTSQLLAACFYAENNLMKMSRSKVLLQD